MHELRDNLNVKCGVCGAGPNEPCLPPKIGQEPDSAETISRDAIAYAEHKLIGALIELRDVKPDHYLVMIIEEVLRKGMDKDTLREQLELPHMWPVFLANQAE